MVNGWKVTAIIFIILFILMVSYLAWGFYLIDKEEQDTKVCYYEICEEYPSAELIDDVCLCYEVDLFGELRIVKSKLIK